MRTRGFTFIGMFLVLGSSFGCHREVLLDDHPVSTIEVSQPPKAVEVQDVETMYERDGVWRVGAMRYYNAVVPMHAKELKCDEKACRFWVPDMRASDVHDFLAKYFPYQVMHFNARRDAFQLEATIKPEYADDAIIPTLDLNILKPTAETAVEMDIFLKESTLQYEWIYKNPMQRQETTARLNAAQKAMDAELARLKAESEVKPSDDSPGEMLNPGLLNAH